MSIITIILTCLLALSSTVWYLYQITRKEIEKRIEPVLSTWIILFTGAILSFGSYLATKENSCGAYVLAITDVVAPLAIIPVIIIYRKSKMVFEPFEKWYLLMVFLITVYGFSSRDAWGCNFSIQILICIGYIPTMHKLLNEKRNTESIGAWTLNLLTNVVALHPAMIKNDILATIYTGREVFFVFLLLGLMVYYDYFYKKI